MKKTICIMMSFVILCLLTSCSKNLTDKNSIIKMYSNHEAEFANVAQTTDFSDLERISGVQKVIVWEEYIDIQCGGSGFGSSTHYYGIFYSETDNLVAIDVAGPLDELIEDGNGYRYRESDVGDNEYYVEPLGNHYFYYEAHF